MAANIVIALLMNVVTFLVHTVGLMLLTHVISYLIAHPLLDGRDGGKTLALAALALGIFVLVGFEMALWAEAMVLIGAFVDFSTAFYFSASAFATTGFTDVFPDKAWRLLGSLEGVVGFLIMGWTAAYLVTSGVRFGPFERDKHF